MFLLRRRKSGIAGEKVRPSFIICQVHQIQVSYRPFKSTQFDETEPVILRAEVEVALKHLKEGKAAGYDSISAEELKAAGEPCVDFIHKLCNKVWNSEQIPEDWGKAIMVPIFFVSAY